MATNSEMLVGLLEARIARLEKDRADLLDCLKDAIALHEVGNIDVYNAHWPVAIPQFKLLLARVESDG